MAKSKAASTGNVAERKVFAPKTYLVPIGGRDYAIRPQPIKQITEFDGAVSAIMDNLGDFGKRYYVVVFEELEDGENELERIGPMYVDEAEEQAKALDGALTRIESDQFELSSVSTAINRAPYAILKLMIPDLEEEHCEQISIPELTWLIDLLVEVNGLDWFRDVIKNLGGPFLEEIGAALADWMRVATLQSSVDQITATATDSTS